MSLDEKVMFSKKRIKEWYEHWGGMVYVAFSGGKDSTVLLHLVRSLYPDVPAVFVDTGLEYPEIKEFVKNTENVTTIRPAMSFNDVIKKYGFPVISKKVSRELHDLKHPTDSNKQSRSFYLTGIKEDGTKSKSHFLSFKYRHLVNAPFEISDKCCEIMKKRPSHKYQKESGRMPYIGIMASDSQMREMLYLKQGCNAFDNNNPTSWPLSIGNDTDVWEYIHKNNVQYCKIYDMGEKRTGCMFCMFGIHMEGTPNRFQRMSKSHPKLYEYCINKLGCGDVMDYIGIDYKHKITLDDYKTDD